MQETGLTTIPSFLVMCTCWSGLVCKSCFTYMALITGTQQPFSCVRGHLRMAKTNKQTTGWSKCKPAVEKAVIGRITWESDGGTWCPGCWSEESEGWKFFYCNSHFDLHNVILWWFLHWQLVSNGNSGEFGDIVDLGQKHCRMMCVLDACLAQRGVGHPVHVGPIKILHS